MGAPSGSAAGRRLGTTVLGPGGQRVRGCCPQPLPPRPQPPPAAPAPSALAAARSPLPPRPRPPPAAPAPSAPATAHSPCPLGRSRHPQPLSPQVSPQCLQLARRKTVRSPPAPPPATALAPWNVTAIGTTGTRHRLCVCGAPGHVQNLGAHTEPHKAGALAAPLQMGAPRLPAPGWLQVLEGAELGHDANTAESEAHWWPARPSGPRWALWGLDGGFLLLFWGF